MRLLRYDPSKPDSRSASIYMVNNETQNKRSLVVLPICLMILSSCGGSGNHIELGKQLLESKQYDQALDEFNLAIQQDPKQYYAYFGQGYAYVNSGHPDLALACAQKAIELKPDDAGSYFVKGQA